MTGRDVIRETVEMLRQRACHFRAELERTEAQIAGLRAACPHPGYEADRCRQCAWTCPDCGWRTR